MCQWFTGPSHVRLGRNYERKSQHPFLLVSDPGEDMGKKLNGYGHAFLCRKIPTVISLLPGINPIKREGVLYDPLFQVMQTVRCRDAPFCYLAKDFSPWGL